MTRSKHTHPCARCQEPMECHGTLEGNYDGWPEMICDIYHLPNGNVLWQLCETCDDNQDDDEQTVQI